MTRCYGPFKCEFCGSTVIGQSFLLYLQISNSEDAHHFLPNALHTVWYFLPFLFRHSGVVLEFVYHNIGDLCRLILCDPFTFFCKVRGNRTCFLD